MATKPKILVTGGPVPTPLDAVKIIESDYKQTRFTNRFKGGLIRRLANALAQEASVIYLTEGGSPVEGLVSEVMPLYHTGFSSYQTLVLELAPRMDAVVLGAAVANLMPQNPWPDKFPSHDYGPEDVIPINFVLTPRIIDQVKRAAPHTHLFGFKLLANADHEELIKAAYGIVLSAGCTIVFANDRSDLNQVYAVTKERAVHPMVRQDIAAWILMMLRDQYYRTEKHPQAILPPGINDAAQTLSALIRRFHDKFCTVESGLIFGTVAVRLPNSGFLTTIRGKDELSKHTTVTSVDHKCRTVHVAGELKATLNAPLLDRIFDNCPQAHAIVHHHAEQQGLPTYQYAPPGIVRDAMRALRALRITPASKSFNIEHHGCFLLLDKNGNQL